jgi:hypothetical protein
MCTLDAAHSHADRGTQMKLARTCIVLAAIAKSEGRILTTATSLAELMFAMTAVQIRKSGTVVSIRDALLTKLLNADVRLRLQGAISAELATA